MPTPQVVFQILPSLVVGGAERLVVHLVEHLSRERFSPVCICLESPQGTHYEARVRALGAPLYFLGKGRWARVGARCASSARCFGSTALQWRIRTSSG
jgi:hypothetical protein